MADEPDEVAIRGQGPTLTWAPNPGGLVRTVTEAVEIARRHGVAIPEDVTFRRVPGSRLGPDTWARGPLIDDEADGYVYWDDHYLDQTHRIPIYVREDVFGSDEAIVAVFAHELYELNELRALFALSRRRRMPFDAYRDHVRPGLTTNLHDRAWAIADALVLKMRGAT